MQVSAGSSGPCAGVHSRSPTGRRARVPRVDSLTPSGEHPLHANSETGDDMASIARSRPSLLSLPIWFAPATVCTSERQPLTNASPTRNLATQASRFHPIGWINTAIGSMLRAIVSMARGAACASRAHTTPPWAKPLQASRSCATNTATATTREATASTRA